MKLIDIHLNTSMSLGHPGLYKKAGKSVADGYVVFINRNWTAMKMLTPGNVLLHYKSPDPRRRPINPETIKYLPHCVEGGDLNYSKALEAVITKEFGKKFS